MKFKSYARYKDSGVEWLGGVPEHWDVIKLQRICTVIDPQPDHRAPSLDESGGGFPYIGIRDVNNDGSLNFESARCVNESAIIRLDASD